VRSKRASSGRDSREGFVLRATTWGSSDRMRPAADGCRTRIDCDATPATDSKGWGRCWYQLSHSRAHKIGMSQSRHSTIAICNVRIDDTSFIVQRSFHYWRCSGATC
jgi:hypothetical protein